MPKQYSKAELASYWFDVYKEQKDGGGFDVTVRHMQEVWGLVTSSAYYRLQKLLEGGLIKTKQHGKIKVYRAKDEFEIDWLAYYEMYTQEVNT